MAAKALEADFDKWQRAHGAKSDLVWLEMSEKSRTINFLLEGMDEFSLRFPEVYPPQNDSHRFSMTAQARSLASWATEVNKMLATGAPMLIGDILTRALAIKKELQTKSKSEKKAPKASDDDELVDDEDTGGGGADDGGADFDLESEELKESLEILRMKKRWAKKEAALREDMRRKRDKEVKSKDKQKVEQIFSTQAASGVLTNDLLSIMEQSETLGFSATPIDDNIYHWNVHLFKFQPDTDLGRQLKELKKAYGYDYVELEIHFTIDLYPFYPPQVKVVRPRFQGFMMGRITSMELLKLSFWDPVKDMKFVLNSIRALIQEHGKIDVNNPVNNPKDHPKGAYSELEYLLLRLELLSEQDPRANLKYPVQVQQVAKASAKKADKSGEFWAKGTGYGYQGQTQWDVQAYLAAQREKDMQTEHVLKSILDQLASSKVTPAQYEVLEESCLLPVLEGYLRNDSLLDISKHAPLYLVVFGLIRALVASETTVPLVDKLAFQKESVHELLRVLHTQATVFLKRVTAQTGGGPQATALAEDIVKTFTAAEAAVQKFRADMSSLEQAVSGGNTQKGAVDLSDPKKLAEAYARCMRPLQFDSFNMRGAGNAYKHHYANKLTGGHASKEKILRLAQEQSALSTSLPLNVESSVFLRVDEERMDLMQAIITGPIDTPYSAGCFLFDIFFPENYPQGPPLVNLMTTGAGSVRFNPNLYNCGKVCLSLLGTWSGAEGENWNRDTSTFLQVLVSIQSLILVPKPFFNEPGYERQMGTPQGDEANRKYNEVIRVATVEFAMLSQLRNPPAGFEEVVRTHFYLKANFIKQQCDQWLQEGRGSNAHYARLLKLTKELKEELDKLPRPASLR